MTVPHDACLDVGTAFFAMGLDEDAVRERVEHLAPPCRRKVWQGWWRARVASLPTFKHEGETVDDRP